jgi:hypothetical protein
MTRRRDWHSLENYIHVHQRYLDNFQTFIIRDDELRQPRFERRANRLEVVWDGTLECRCGIRLRVVKRQETQERKGRLYVRTVRYRYAAWRETSFGPEQIFVYDNLHRQPGHPDEFHRHVYSGKAQTVEWVGRENWPFLSELLKQLYDYSGQRCGPASQ